MPQAAHQHHTLPPPRHPLEAVEDGVTALYHHVQLSPTQIEQLRDSVRAELDSATTEAHRQAEQATRRLAALHDERTRLMQAHYADAVPLDLLKTEMHRLTATMHAAEQQTSTAQTHLADIEAVLEQALLVAGACHRAYTDAPALIKRQINQGFFTKLLIDQDGSVERAELTEPFAQLLTSKWQTVTGGAQNTPDTTGRLPTPRTPGETPPASLNPLGRPRCVLADVTVGRTKSTPDGQRVGGVNVDGLVDLLEALANPCYEVRRLLAMADVWREADNHVLTR